jgi:hypothetical protein
VLIAGYLAASLTTADVKQLVSESMKDIPPARLHLKFGSKVLAEDTVMGALTNMSEIHLTVSVKGGISRFPRVGQRT